MRGEWMIKPGSSAEQEPNFSAGTQCKYSSGYKYFYYPLTFSCNVSNKINTLISSGTPL